jgi:hypothetical protein
MKSPVVSGGEVGLLDLELAARVCAIPCGKLDVKLPRLPARGPGWLSRWGCLARLWRRVAREFMDLRGYLMDHGCPLPRSITMGW